MALLAFSEVLVLREVVAVGASGRFSSHSFNKWCLSVLERKGRLPLVLIFFNSGGQALYLRLNASKRHPGT